MNDIVTMSSYELNDVTTCWRHACRRTISLRHCDDVVCYL